MFFFRQNAWTNPQSSSAITARPPQAAGSAPPANFVQELPDGVRVVLELPPGRAIAGTLVRDWVRPTLGRPQP